MIHYRVAFHDTHPLYRVVDGNGQSEPDAEAFLMRCALNGYSTYTLRSYARGLAHFHTWCAGQALSLVDLTPQTLTAYLAAYRGPPLNERQPRTTNHRLSVLASYYRFLLEHHGSKAGWTQKTNPVPGADETSSHRTMPLRKRAARQRADLRRRPARCLPGYLNPHEVQAVYAAAHTWRDRALLKLLEWTGQRVGDWHGSHGRHGVLGLELSDVDEVRRTITVRLKGARHEHSVPVAEDFWEGYHQYLRLERPEVPHSAVWVTFRKGHGQPLSYAALESLIRALRRRSGVQRLHLHAYRHTFAQNLLETTGNLVLVQTFLGHASIETTASTYLRVNVQEMARAIQKLEQRGAIAEPSLSSPGSRYAFDYDPHTLRELEGLFQHEEGRDA